MRKKQYSAYASKIVPISPGKAFLGFAADFFLSFGLMMIAIFFIAPHLQNAMGYDKAIDKLGELATDSHLYHVNVTSAKVEPSLYLYGVDYPKKITSEGKIAEAYGEGDKDYVGHYPFELYQDIIYSYYMDFSYAGRGSIISIDGKVVEEAKSFSKSEMGRYIGENYFRITDDESSLYSFKTDEGGNPLYEEKPILNEDNPTVQALRGEKPLPSVATLDDFFLSDKTGVYVKAKDGFLTAEPLYKQYFGEAENLIFLAKIPTRLVPPFLFLLLIPLILRDGKSVGRLLTFSAVIDKRGYCASKGRILIHQGILFLPWLLALLPYDVLALFSVGLLYLGDFLVFNLSFSKRSFHEIAAGTLTVNDVDSSYFASKKDMDDYLHANPDAYEEEEEVEEPRVAPKQDAFQKKADVPTHKTSPQPKEKASEEARWRDEDDFLDGK